MQLGHYLATNEISFSEFARRIGTPHARTVERYAKGHRVPAGRMMAAIMSASGGSVQPADFMLTGSATASGGDADVPQKSRSKTAIGPAVA